jgi:CheY-like chemotaxis protein
LDDKLDLVVLALVDDLFFLSRVRETAQQVAVPLTICRTIDAFRAQMAATPPELVLVDMNIRSGDALTLVRELRAQPALADLPIVAWIFDAQEERMADAERAGCSRVLSRGQFTRALPEILRGVATGNSIAGSP